LSADLLRIVTLGGLGINVGVVGQDRDFPGRLQFSFEFDTARTHFAGLNAETRMIRIAGRHIGLGDFKQ